MEKHNNKERATIVQFEQTAQELIHIMLTLCEKRIAAAGTSHSPVGDTLAEAALAVKASIRTFVFIERLRDK